MRNEGCFNYVHNFPANPLSYLLSFQPIVEDKPKTTHGTYM
jgi:hypothetical protein